MGCIEIEGGQDVNFAPGDWYYPLHLVDTGFLGRLFGGSNSLDYPRCCNHLCYYVAGAAIEKQVMNLGV
jgi:hypothetical protein